MTAAVAARKNSLVRILSKNDAEPYDDVLLHALYIDLVMNVVVRLVATRC
jgi:hypothetical protein